MPSNKKMNFYDEDKCRLRKPTGALKRGAGVPPVNIPAARESRMSSEEDGHVVSVEGSTLTLAIFHNDDLNNVITQALSRNRDAKKLCLKPKGRKYVLMEADQVSFILRLLSTRLTEIHLEGFDIVGCAEVLARTVRNTHAQRKLSIVDCRFPSKKDISAIVDAYKQSTSLDFEFVFSKSPAGDTAENEVEKVSGINKRLKSESAEMDYLFFDIRKCLYSAMGASFLCLLVMGKFAWFIPGGVALAPLMALAAFFVSVVYHFLSSEAYSLMQQGSEILLEKHPTSFVGSICNMRLPKVISLS